MRKIQLAFAVLFCSAFMFSCNDVKTTGTTTDSAFAKHPEWILQGNIYEVNIRQYTPEGTFNAFAKHLDRLQKMGVQTLWFMPINPISVKDRKGSLGSYYAIADYTAINPEYGTLDDWNNLVKSAHEKGMKVIIDWVANHTGADNHWLTAHPDFYEKDSTGKFIAPFDWTDVRKLNYKNMEMQDSMIASMKYWLKESNIDGFRCDVAGEVPDSFWSRCITELKKEKQVLMLAEGDKPGLQKAGFDITYAWPMFAKMKLVAKGERPAFALDSVMNTNDTTFPKGALYMNFTSNHDENSWNKADFETMPGDVHAPFAVYTQTVGSSVPLIYSGQEEPFLRAIKFFDKDTITFGQYKREAFYTTLLSLRKNNAALASNAIFKKVNVGDETAVYAYTKVNGDKKVLVILNLSAKPQNILVNDASLHGEPKNVFSGAKEKVGATPFTMQPWAYLVYEY